MGNSEQAPCKHAHRRKRLQDDALGRWHSHRSLCNPLRQPTRPWPFLALLLIACQSFSACDAVQETEAGLPVRQQLLGDDPREWHESLMSSQREEAEEDDVEATGQGMQQRRKLSGTPWVGRRRWHMLSLTECDTFRRRLLASANSSSGHERWPRGEYKRQDGQCWSHAEWFCFAGVPFKSRPSPRLLNLLHLYRSHVRECSALDGPSDWARLRDSLASGRPSACQYVLWSPTEDGLGNQMLSLVSAFMYSLLTFRVLLVEPVSSSISHLFCEPFLRTPSWRFPHVDQFGGRRGFTSGPFIKNYSYLINDEFVLNKPPPNVLAFHIHLWSDMQPFMCPETHHWAAEASALVMSSNLYWLPGLYFVPHFRRKLEALFPSRRAFATLAPFILHPSNRVWAQVTTFLLRHTPTTGTDGQATTASDRHADKEAAGADELPAPAASPLRIGLQFRAQFGIPVREAVNGSVACLRRIHRLLHHDPSWAASPQEQDPMRGAWLSQLSRQGMPGAGSGVPETESPSDSAGASFTLLMASLDEEFKEGVVAQLKKGTEGGEAQAGEVVGLTSDTGQRFGDLEHNERALIEILSVALSSQVVLVTPRSTFGYTIAGLSSGVPFFIPPCEPAMPEPCFLRPVTNVQCKFSRFRVEGGHIRGVRLPLLRPCPDAQWLHKHWQKQPSTGVVAIDKDVPYEEKTPHSDTG